MKTPAHARLDKSSPAVFFCRFAVAFAGFVPSWTNAQTGLKWHFEFSGGAPNKLVWQTEVGPSYYLFRSENLTDWTYEPAFPQAGTGGTMEHAFTPGSRGFFRIIPAGPAPDGFALIPAGSFQMGNTFWVTTREGSGYETPVHTVQVSAFYMATNLVTNGRWAQVRTWGLTHGYTDLAVGSVIGSSSYNRGDNYPVGCVTWYDTVKWCNARSEMEGLVPCYYTDAAQTTIYQTGGNDLDNANVKWTANGYRLPTEAEWEKAARGGLVGRRFPWGDTIEQTQANYMVYSQDGQTNYYFYDVNPRPPGNVGYYYHPVWYSRAPYPNPYTSTVGSFAPNGYGLCDMAGNLFEWCWDWFDTGYYADSPGIDPRGPASDPRGPAGPSPRVGRGGSWHGPAEYCRAGRRDGEMPGRPDATDLGFRVARSAVP